MYFQCEAEIYSHHTDDINLCGWTQFTVLYTKDYPHKNILPGQAAILLFTDVTDTRALTLYDIIKNDLVRTRKSVIESVSTKERQIFFFVLPT